ncbi:Glucose-6-phosphate isomerase isoform 1 [Hibiscus syriacus]|uniref:Glucose-6-phosphate isomerase isoform 1 n=1 Tax=Hibiscus syriacus TaxID=106335 RepID=A0A6A2WJ19_HIBSY|nr:Glucose-6-phosphate isomerase isoform 1 [Hibiscus syriacus]
MIVDWDDHPDEAQKTEQDYNLNFDFLSIVSKPKDYYKILEVDFDATEDAIRSNYIHIALKWHPNKQKDDENNATSRFQEINEAYQVLIDPVKRSEYDKKGMLYAYDYNIIVRISSIMLRKKTRFVDANGAVEDENKLRCITRLCYTTVVNIKQRNSCNL